MSRSNTGQFAQFKRRIEDGLMSIVELVPRNADDDRPSVGYLYILPAIIIVGFLAVGLGLLVQYSFFTTDPTRFFIREYTLSNWMEYISSSAYQTVFVRTIATSSLITIITLIFSFPYAYLTIRTESAVIRKILLTCVFVPFFTGVVVRAYGWLIILGEQGLLNAAITSFNIEPISLLGTLPAVALGILQIMIPFAVMMLAPAIQSIDRSMELAAQNLGANWFETFRYVVIPLSKPGLAAATIVVFTISTALFAIPQIIGLGQQNFIANIIYRTLFISGNYPLAAAMSVSLVVVVSILIGVIFYSIGSGTLGVDSDDTDE